MSLTRHETSPQISVIIPVYNDLGRLRQCIKALQCQTIPASEFEILVVDNLSTQPLMIDCDVRRGPLLKMLHERKAGSYAARNLGVLSARAQLIAFTDSDCVPATTWLEEGRRILASRSTRYLIGGAIAMSYQDPLCPSILELYDQAVHLRQKDYVLLHGFAATANMMVPRTVFDEVGLFRDDLKSKGDMEWCERARRSGFLLDYAEKALVTHPCRRTLMSLIKKNRRTVGGIYDRFFQQGWREIFRREFNEFRRKHQSINKSFDYRQPWLKVNMYCLLWFLEGIRLLEIFRVTMGGSTARE